MAYRGLADRRMVTWSCVVATSRLPVAMAPLAFVFLDREVSGGYTRGAVMAAAYTAAEAVGAPLLGARLRSRPFRREIAVGLGVCSLFFGAFALVPAAPAPVVVAMAAVAGAAGAAVPGALRSMVADLVPERALHSALSWESSLNMAVWAVAPALVTTAAARWSAAVPFLVAAAATLTGAACVFLLPEKTGVRDPAGQRRGTAGPLASVWRIYLTSAAAMYLLATVELALPALLEQRGRPVAYSGPLLTGFALTGIFGGLLYGLRTWPGGPERHSTLLLYATVAATGAMATAPAIGVMSALLLLAGLCQAVVLIARNLSLQRALPPDLHPVGYSLQYAGSGIGYGISAAATGLLLAHTRPSTTVLIAAAVTLVLTTATVPGRNRLPPGGEDRQSAVGNDHRPTGAPSSQDLDAPGRPRM
ncbi:MFS transporter [Streptomyces lavendulocolor]|uniref:MFS transporter n=1 Tax=Streptomyces lavendulocolor TaxID=67316 RepID=A0ABV2W8T6_9ACTN